MSPGDGHSLAVLVTSHNRKATTLQCLRALRRCTVPAGIGYDIFLVDDGSTDQTAEAVKAEFLNATILRGDGSLFWNRGMHAAFAAAREHGYRYYLWLNDDTVLYEGALETLFGAYASVLSLSGPGIIVGSTVDPQTGMFTYGGRVRTSRWLPLRFSPVTPTTEIQRCDAMNGNVVLIPDFVARKVGNLDYRFEHSMGDTDYALRARNAGIRTWVAPGAVGECKRNPPPRYADTHAPLTARLRSVFDRKHHPMRSWSLFAWRHGGSLWPVYLVWPYAKVVASSLRRKR